MASPTLTSLAKDLAALTTRVAAIEERVSALEKTVAERGPAIDQVMARFGPWQKGAE